MRHYAKFSSDFLCLECGNVFPLSRSVECDRPLYHIKDLYCYNCDKVTKFTELKDATLIKKKLEFADHQTDFEKIIYDLLCKNDEKDKALCKTKNI